MNNITKETRKESFEKIQLKKKNKLIYEQLGSGEYTARELAIKMYNTTDEEGNTKVYASIYNPDQDETKLLPIETEKEWKIIETILEELQNETANHGENKE